MTFPPDVVERMLAHDKPVVTCNYRKKNPKEVIGTVGDFSGKEISSEGKTGLEQVYSMGMGMVLFKVSELKHIPRPYFAVLWDNKAGKYAIEDAVFSLVLHENKVPIYCDHDLSKEIGHVGEVEYCFSKE